MTGAKSIGQSKLIRPQKSPAFVAGLKIF